MRKAKPNKSSRKRKRRKRLGAFRLVCWIILPAATVLALTLDGLGLYLFNIERLLVLGASCAITLLPFFSEITVNSLSLKKEKEE